jgi:hypothetical protein
VLALGATGIITNETEVLRVVQTRVGRTDSPR